MRKTYKTTIIIMAIVMLVSYWAIDAICIRHFSEWNEHMGILAFIFKIIIVGLIGFAIAPLTERKVIKKDEVINDIYELEIKNEQNTMLRSKAALSIWIINLFLLIAFMLLMVAFKIAVAAWCILLLIAINLIGFFVCFDREDKKH